MGIIVRSASGGGGTPEDDGVTSTGWNGTNARSVTSFPYIAPIRSATLGTPNSIGEANKLSKCQNGAQSEYLATAGWHGGPAYRVRPCSTNEGWGAIGPFEFAASPSIVHIRACVKHMGGSYIDDTSKLCYIKTFGPDGTFGDVGEGRLVPWWWGAKTDGGGSYFSNARFDWQSGGTIFGVQPASLWDDFKIGASYSGSPNFAGEWFAIEMAIDLVAKRGRTWLTTRDGTFNETLVSDTNSSDFWYPNNTPPGYYGSSFATVFADKDEVVDCEGIGGYWWTDAVPFPLSLNSSDDIYITDIKIDDSYVGPPAGFVTG